MPSAITAFGADAFLNMIFGQRTEVPTEFYVALLTQAPGEATTGELLTEPEPETGYGRVGILNDDTFWGEAVGGFVATIANVEFEIAIEDWPVVTHYALCEGTFTGGVYLYGSFAVPRKVLAGDRVTIPGGLLSLTASSLTTAVVGAF